MSKQIELPAGIVIRDLAQKIEKSPIEIIKKLMSNGVMATINQSVDFDTAAIVVAEYGFEAIPEVLEEVKPEETGENPFAEDSEDAIRGSANPCLNGISNGCLTRSARWRAGSRWRMRAREVLN